MVIKSYKNAYSLTEVLVVMVLLMFFFIASSKVMTQKPKLKQQINPHGNYECYNDAGELRQVLTLESTEINNENVTQCKFQPLPGIAMYNMHAIMQEGGYQNTEPNINDTIYIHVSSEGAISILDADGETVTLESNTTIDKVKLYFQAIHKDSKIYNSGSVKPGLMISW